MTAARSDPLVSLNGQPDDAAREVFLALGGSRRWADAMVAARPFADREAVRAAADQAFDGLGDADWLEAIGSHAPIGAPRAGDAQGASEQSGMSAASDDQRGAMAQANAEYRERFGYVFLIRAAGRSAAEMLAAIQQRLTHDPAQELAVAAGQLREITQLRLAEWLSE